MQARVPDTKNKNKRKKITQSIALMKLTVKWKEKPLMTTKTNVELQLQ